MTFCKCRWIIIIMCIVEPQCNEDPSKFLDCGFQKLQWHLWNIHVNFGQKKSDALNLIIGVANGFTFLSLHQLHLLYSSSQLSLSVILVMHYIHALLLCYCRQRSCSSKTGRCRKFSKLLPQFRVWIWHRGAKK